MEEGLTCFARVQLGVEPGTGKRPVAAHRGLGQVENLGHFSVIETGEISEFYPKKV